MRNRKRAGTTLNLLCGKFTVAESFDLCLQVCWCCSALSVLLEPVCSAWSLSSTVLEAQHRRPGMVLGQVETSKRDARSAFNPLIRVK